MCSPSTRTLRHMVESVARPIHDPLKVDTCPAALMGSTSTSIAVIRPRVSDFIGGLSHDEDFALRDLHDIDPAGDGKDRGHVERQRTLNDHEAFEERLLQTVTPSQILT